MSINTKIQDLEARIKMLSLEVVEANRQLRGIVDLVVHGTPFELSESPDQPFAEEVDSFNARMLCFANEEPGDETEMEID